MKLTEELLNNFVEAKKEYYSNIIMSEILALVSAITGSYYVAITYTIISMLLLTAELVYFSKSVQLEDAENRIKKMLFINSNFKLAVVLITFIAILKYLI